MSLKIDTELIAVYAPGINNHLDAAEIAISKDIEATDILLDDLLAAGVINKHIRFQHYLDLTIAKISLLGQLR